MKLLSIILSATMLFKAASPAAFMVTLTGTKGSVFSIEDNSEFDNDKTLGSMYIGGSKNKFSLDGISFETSIDYGFQGSIYFVNLNSQNDGNGLGKFSIYTSYSGLDALGSNSAQLDYNGTGLSYPGTANKSTAQVVLASFIDPSGLGLSDSFELKNNYAYATNDSKQVQLNGKYFSFNNLIEVDLNNNSKYDMNTSLSAQVVLNNPTSVPEPKNILLPSIIMGVMIISRRRR